MLTLEIRLKGGRPAGSATVAVGIDCHLPGNDVVAKMPEECAAT